MIQFSVALGLGDTMGAELGLSVLSRGKWDVSVSHIHPKKVEKYHCSEDSIFLRYNVLYMYQEGFVWSEEVLLKGVCKCNPPGYWPHSMIIITNSNIQYICQTYCKPSKIKEYSKFQYRYLLLLILLPQQDCIDFFFLKKIKKNLQPFIGQL